MDAYIHTLYKLYNHNSHISEDPRTDLSVSLVLLPCQNQVY